jgi:hypothetical protein
MRRFDPRASILFVVAMTLPACAARPEQRAQKLLEALATADSFALLSLDGDIGFSEREIEPGNDFHGWPILGQVEITDPAVRKSLLDALTKGIRENADGKAFSCFNPRHGIKAVVDGQQLDIVICFECSRAKVYADAEGFEDFKPKGSPQMVFDEVLQKAGVKRSSRT